ncbi:hypothetical protein [Amaricoccus solimangrovi]|uniref:Uncharacterized protein n=1 Tax=Amaricoccus solimangrovi TaxID=2589815 RepID=A0A501WET9_9RHOB|nr:hypothetical protein [Amaricoccus solimangrovi]TPE46860.1 hypothetical protein FJM51_21300 [Amaricoccus solimangrovi]
MRASPPAVLVVEDDPLLRLAAVDFVEDAGFPASPLDDFAAHTVEARLVGITKKKKKKRRPGRAGW